MRSRGRQYFFQVHVYLDELDPEAVKVELYAQGHNGGAPIRQPMKCGERLLGTANGFVYSIGIPKDRPASDCTPSLIPQRTGASVPLEAAFALWHEARTWRKVTG